MIQSANKFQITEIFAPDTLVKYVIPKYQREYVWSKKEWDELLDDLNENENEHFLGSIICVDKGKDVLALRPLEVIDGQQRLTTISLLYATIYNKLLQEKRADEEFIAERNNLKHRLIQKKFPNELKLELSEQKKNFPDYKAILSELKLLPEQSRPQNMGNRKIYRAYQYYIEKLSNFSYDQLLALLGKINSAWLVKIEVNSYADAFILFESLNNRGVPLSAMELIKNNVFAELEEKKPGSVDAAFNTWKLMTDNITEASDQERFLRHYYNAFRFKDAIKIKGVARAIRSNLIKIYEELVKRDVRVLFDDLTSKSNVYQRFVTPDEVDRKDGLHQGLTDLTHIGATPAYTFLLYLFSEHPEKKELLQETVSFLTSYFVRRNLLDSPPTRDLDAIFIGLIDHCETNKSNLTMNIITDYLTSPVRCAATDAFEEKLRGNIYEDNVDVARFILCKLEETHQTRETYRNLWVEEKGKPLWTIEHIFPEGEKLPPEWVKMIANGDADTARKLQEQWVHKLGNLTLTGYNSKLSNMAFQRKRDRKDDSGRAVGYKNGLHLNSALAAKEEWTIGQIKERTDVLVREAMNLFKLEKKEV